MENQRLAPGAKMGMALRASSLSPNRVRRVGAILVARDGTEIAACNTFPAGVRDLEERHQGDGRFVWMEHAERRAIFEAAVDCTKKGIKVLPEVMIPLVAMVKEMAKIRIVEAVARC